MFVFFEFLGGNIAQVHKAPDFWWHKNKNCAFPLRTFFGEKIPVLETDFIKNIQQEEHIFRQTNQFSGANKRQ